MVQNEVRWVILATIVCNYITFGSFACHVLVVVFCWGRLRSDLIFEWLGIHISLLLHVMVCYIPTNTIANFKDHWSSHGLDKSHLIY